MEEKKKNLKNIYEVINKIARNHKESSDWFYTSEQLKELKKDKSKIFLN